jgi:surface protein
MDGMFQDARAFNQPIRKWNTGRVINMRRMFQGASSFDQNISNWNVLDCRTAIGMFDGSGMKEENQPTFPDTAMTS